MSDDVQAALDAAMASTGIHVDLRRGDKPRPIGCASCQPAIAAILVAEPRLTLAAPVELLPEPEGPGWDEEVRMTKRDLHGLLNAHAAQAALAAPVDAERLRWAKWITEVGVTRGGDWACPECRPYSDMLVEGFRCVYHEASAALAESPR